jgi:hypothetical protein
MRQAVHTLRDARRAHAEVGCRFTVLLARNDRQPKTALLPGRSSAA